MKPISDTISKYLFYPLWDVWDRSVRLRHLRELERSQWLSREELQQRQWTRLKHIIEYAYRNCPWYTERFKEFGIEPGDIRTAADFASLPPLTKSDIQNNTDLILSREFDRRRLFTAKTGGSTGVALHVLFDKRCSEMRNACAARHDMWAGWDLGMKRAAIWGNPPVADTLKKKLRSALHDRTIFLDTMNLNERSMSEFVELWRRYRPGVMFGHSHSIFMFAQFVLAKNITDLRPRGIISSSMMLIESERDIIERAFGCKVTDRYGCEEVSLIACECEQHNGMHINIDHLYVEFVKGDGTYAQPGEEGEIVITDLINHGMPFIRYRIADVGVPSDRICECGRGLPMMDKVIGRTADFLLRPDGSLVAGVSLVERTLTKLPGIEQMQILQEELDRLQLKVVPGDRYDQQTEQQLIAEFREVFPESVKIEVVRMDKLSQERSGKYRFAISKIERPAWAVEPKTEPDDR